MTRYRLRMWAMEDVGLTEVEFFAHTDQEAIAKARLVARVMPNALMIHLERKTWETVERFLAEPGGRGELTSRDTSPSAVRSAKRR